MITEQEYTRLKLKYETYHKARKELCGSRNYVTPEDSELLPESPTSSEISSIEVYEFITNPPKKYFAYVNVRTLQITTWTGETLGEIMAYGRHYKSNMGDDRVNISVDAVNGKRYYGTFYKSAGDYCRLTISKSN